MHHPGVSKGTKGAALSWLGLCQPRVTSEVGTSIEKNASRRSDCGQSCGGNSLISDGRGKAQLTEGGATLGLVVLGS